MSLCLVDIALLAVAALVLASGTAASDQQRRTPIVVHVEQGGFQWSDAAVGALAGFGISLAAAGCVALVRPSSARDTTRAKGQKP